MPLATALLVPPEARFLGVQGYMEGSFGIGNVTDHTPVFNYTFYDSDGDSQYQRNISVYDVKNSEIIFFDNATEISSSGTNITFEYPATAEPLINGGKYIFRVECNDTTGNWSSTSTLEFIMNVPPQAVLSDPKNGSTNVSLFPNLGWIINYPYVGEDPSTYFWYVNKSGSSLIVANGSTTHDYGSFTAEPWTTYYWRLCAYDGYEWTNSTYWHFTTKDSSEPSSSMEAIFPYFKNLPFDINISATDTFSGLKNITLYYKHSKDNVTWTNWTVFSVDTGPNWTCHFNYPNGDGYYQLLSLAIDNSSNLENKSDADGICCYDATRPVIDYHSPETSSNITTTIVVYFSESMNRPSVENAFSMKRGTEEIVGTFTWDSKGKNLIFTPSSSLAYNSSYQIIISSIAMDISNNSLLTDYKWNFTTRSPLSTDDIDEDNLPDQWEMAYFDDLVYGLNDDPDNDGYTNLEEYQNETDPNDSESYPSESNYSWVFFPIILALILVIIVIWVIKRRRE